MAASRACGNAPLMHDHARTRVRVSRARACHNTATVFTTGMLEVLGLQLIFMHRGN